MSTITSQSVVDVSVTVPYPWWESSGCLVLRLDSMLRVHGANGAAEALFAVEVAGRPWLSLLDASSRDRALALAHLARTDAWTIELPLSWRVGDSLVLLTRLIQVDSGLVVCGTAALHGLLVGHAE